MSKADIERLRKLLEQALQAGYLDINEWLQQQNSLEAIEARILAGNFAAAIQSIDDAALKLAADIHQSYVTSGQASAKWLDAQVSDRLVRFDTAAPEVVARAKANELDLVQGFREERNQVARQIAQRAIQESATLGENPRRVAQDFRDSIGLTASQEQAVANYRRALESQDYSNALGRELRDRRADRTLNAARREEQPLTPAQINSLVARYRDNYLGYRAETIARTEALRNANGGAADSIQQAIDRGDVEAAQLAKEWHAGPNTRDARQSHQTMDGKVVRQGEDFILPDGTRMSQPGDPRGGAEHCANCRCTFSVTYVDIPEGYSTQGGTQLKEGVPARRADIDESALYAITPEQLRDQLRALPGGGDDENRMQSIRDAIASGRKLPPVDLSMTQSGNLVVNDGRHRLLVAMESGGDVLARLSAAAPGASEGTVRLAR